MPKPFLPDHLRRDRRIIVPLTQDEYQTIAALAKARGYFYAGSGIRDILMPAVRAELERETAEGLA